MSPSPKHECTMCLTVLLGYSDTTWVYIWMNSKYHLASLLNFELPVATLMYGGIHCMSTLVGVNVIMPVSD